jgi:hypothetical protein
VVDPAGWEAVLDAPPNRLVEAAGAEGVDVPGVVVVGVAPKENPPGFGAVDAAPVFAPPNRLPPVAPPVAEPAPNKPPEAGAAPGVDDPNRLVPDAGWVDEVWVLPKREVVWGWVVAPWAGWPNAGVVDDELSDC